MRHRLIAVVLAAAAVAAAPSLAEAAPLKFTLEVSPIRGAITDQYQAIVQIEMAGLSGPDRYVPPDFGDFAIVDSKVSQGTASVVDPTHGQSIRTTIVRRYTLSPRTSGRLRIKPARIRIDGDEFETREVWVRVSARPGTAADVQTGDPTAAAGVGVPGFAPPEHGGDMFLHAVADTHEPYVGQQVTVTWMLYTRSEVLKFEPRPPSQIGYTAEVLYEPDSYFTYHEDRVAGVPYVVAIVSKRAVFPGRSGRLEIPPFEARVSTLETPLGRAQVLKSPAIELSVRPLPTGAPAGFDPSFVGDFTATAAVDRSEIDAAESLTLELTIEGEGDLRNLEPPALSFPGFTFRAPRDDQPTVDTSGDRVHGKRVFRYWTTPEKGGAQTLPGVELAFFDPRAGHYQVVSTRPIPILVRGDPAALASRAAASHENVITRDIRLYRPGTTISSRMAPLLYRHVWFWLLAGLPPLGFALVVVTDRLRQRVRKETPRARLRRARGKARQRFRVAEIHLKGNRAPKFFGELSRALYEHLEERIGQPIQSMTRDELREFLRIKGFENAVINQIDGDLEAFDFARFAPTLAGPGEMRAALRRVKDLLGRIEKTRLTDDAVEDSGRAA